MTFEITFNACALNSYSVDPEIADFEYIIDQGEIQKQGSFVSRFAGCPSPMYKLKQVGFAGDFNTDFFTFDPSSPIVKINIRSGATTGDYTL
jgi:hypothetical protein